MNSFPKNIRPIANIVDQNETFWQKVKTNYYRITYYLRWECSVTYRICEMIPTPVVRLFSKINTLWYARIINMHWIVKTSLPKNMAWHSAEKRILYANMSLFKEWYETEAKTTEWSGYEELVKAKTEFDTIYSWWSDYSNKEKEIQQAYDNWMPFAPDFKFGNNSECIIEIKDPIKDKELMAVINDLEEQLIRQEEIMLIKLMANRRFMFD